MSGFHKFLLCFCVLGYVFCRSEAYWHVKMPSHIEGLWGSCLVIPCSFDYSNTPPRPDRVVWYQYVDHGYPLVYDDWYPYDVIPIFQGKTNVFTSWYRKTCSLEIYPVTWSHDRQKIYPWVDPENVGKSTYRFFDTTVTIQVVGQAKEPDIMITGDMRVGESVTVQCSVDHTCRTYPPTLSLNIPLRNHRLTHTETGDGTRTTLITTLLIERDHETIECSVRHQGGLTAKASKALNAQCSVLPLTISSTSEEFLEGLASNVFCTATYTCPKDIPTLSWNYAGMSATTVTAKEKDKTLWKTVSTLTLTSSANDHGRSLTCTAWFTQRQTQQQSITLRVKRNMHSLGWSFSTPRSITGLKGSCVVIPCKFIYSSSQPDDLQVIWYLYQSNAYPAVFNKRHGNVVSKFNGRTSLIGSVADSNCSLKIDRLEMSHNQDRLYPWIDKSPITSYHSHGFSFYDKTTQIFVSDRVEEPQLSIIGIPKVGEQSTVSCSVRHTCLPAPPVITLSGIPGRNQIKDSMVNDGIWERTIEQTWDVEEEHRKVECIVQYPSSQRATKELLLNVECPHSDISMTEPPGQITEGVATSVICSVSYKCTKNKPTIEWNYNDMQSSTETKRISSNTYTTLSNLTFIGSLSDNGKSLTCTAHFNDGKTSDSANLQIIKYEEPAEEVEPHHNEIFHVLAADVPFRISALTRSCVVIPCTFQDREDEPMTRGIWSKKSGGIIFHNGRSYVTDHFRDRTRLLGDLNEGDCSLEIDDIKPFDNGPFCFYGEKGDDEYRFNNSCAFIVMKASPEKPVMTSVPAEVDAGSTVTVSCSVNHTCSSHPPEFSWSVPNITSQVSDTLMSPAIWQRTSTITFMVSGGDGVKSLTCTAIFWREKQQASTVTLVVKGTMMYQLRGSAPVAFPVSLLGLLLIIFASVCGVFMHRKRRKHTDNLTPPPRPEKRRSLWDRLSRRYPQGDREKPPRPEKRKSMWSRFSRRMEEDRFGWQNTRKSIWSRFSRRQDNAANLSVSYINNANTVVCNSAVSKQRFPSPKNKQRRLPPAIPEVRTLISQRQRSILGSKRLPNVW